MAPRKEHKLSRTSYNFIERFLSEQWYIVTEDRGNADSKDKVSIDVIWESFKIFMDDHGYSSTFCNKILLGRLLHQCGVEKIKRGPRKQQRFYYFPIRAVEGSKTEEIYRKRKAAEDLDGSFVSPPGAVKPVQGDLPGLLTGPSTSGYVWRQLPVNLPTSAEYKPEAGVLVAPNNVPVQKRNTKPCTLSLKPKCVPAPVRGAVNVSNTENPKKACLEGIGHKLGLTESVVTKNVRPLQEARRNNQDKGSTRGAGINTMSNGSSSSVYDKCFNCTITAPNNLTKQALAGKERWQGNSDNGRNLQSTGTNVKREGGTTSVMGESWDINYLAAHNSLSLHLPKAFSYTDCFDPLFCSSSSVRTDQQTSTAARRENEEPSRWTDLPYVPNFVNDPMAEPFTYWGAAEGTEPLDLTTSNKRVA